MQTYEAASKGAQGALGFGGAPLRLAERKARNPALRAGKSLGFGGAPLRLAERKARNPALRAGKVSFCVCRSCFLLPFVSLSCASEEAAEGVAFPQEDGGAEREGFDPSNAIGPPDPNTDPEFSTPPDPFASIALAAGVHILQLGGDRTGSLEEHQETFPM
jgi:hypothetical protein